MKKHISKCIFVLLFFLFSLALFSTELTRSTATKGPVEEGMLIQSANEMKVESSESSYSNNIESKANVPIEKNNDEKANNVELQNETKDEKINTSTAEDTQKESSIAQPKENETEDKKTDDKDNENTEFSSIQVSGLTLANGNEWYFEEYDESGNMIGAISYNNNKMILKSNIEYDNGKKKK